MAIKTDAEIGNAIRTALINCPLNSNEEINKVTIILSIEVKNLNNNTIYGKGGKGIELNNYNKDNEELNIKW